MLTDLKSLRDRPVETTGMSTQLTSSEESLISERLRELGYL
jgi:hypothetical protein